MAVRSEDFTSINELDARTRKLIDDAVTGTDQMLTDEDGNARAAIVDAHKLEHYRQLDSLDIPSPFTLKDLAQGLEEAAAGRVMSAEEFRKSMDDRLDRVKKRAQEIIDAKNGDR